MLAIVTGIVKLKLIVFGFYESELDSVTLVMRTESAMESTVAVSTIYPYLINVSGSSELDACYICAI